MEGLNPPKGSFDHGYPYWPKKECMRLQPHGWTVLVEPDLPPEKTDSNILLPEDHFFIPTSGTVVAVGKGSKREWDARNRAYRKALDAFDPEAEYADSDAFDARERIRMMSYQPEPTASVRVGERVVFAAQAGLTIKDEDGKEYILLDEDRIAIIVEEESNVA